MLLEVAALVDQLFLTFNLGAQNVKLSVFLSKVVVLHFKLLVKTSLYFGLALLLSLGLQSLKAFKHVLAHLLGCLLLVVKLLLVLAFFSCEQRCKFCLALFEISCVTVSYFINTVLYYSLLNHLFSLLLPLGS